MRELVFNDACLIPLRSSFHEIAPLLIESVKGIAALLLANVATKSLRMRRELFDCKCTEHHTLWDVIVDIQRKRINPDMVSLLLSLSQKVPLISELPPDIVGRFNGCQPASPTTTDGEALVLCAHTAAIAVSLATSDSWRMDEVLVFFDELGDDGEIERVEEKIDHLSSAAHAAPIIERNRKAQRANVTLANFWAFKSAAFPSLRFGPDVEAQLDLLDEGVFPQIVKRLSELEESAQEWRNIGGGSPRWRSVVSPEGEHRINDQRIRARLTFRSEYGAHRLFEWHARYGGAGRIHLCFYPAQKVIEIGYIGRKIQ